MCDNVADWHIWSIGLKKRILQHNKAAESKYIEVPINCGDFICLHA